MFQLSKHLYFTKGGKKEEGKKKKSLPSNTETRNKHLLKSISCVPHWDPLSPPPPPPQRGEMFEPVLQPGLSPGVSGLTAAQAAVCGQLQSPLGAVPAVPCKLVFALLYATLSSCCHAARVDQVRLRQTAAETRGKYKTHGVMTACFKIFRWFRSIWLDFDTQIYPP